MSSLSGDSSDCRQEQRLGVGALFHFDDDHGQVILRRQAAGLVIDVVGKVHQQFIAAEMLPQLQFIAPAFGVDVLVVAEGDFDAVGTISATENASSLIPP